MGCLGSLALALMANTKKEGSNAAALPKGHEIMSLLGGSLWSKGPSHDALLARAIEYEVLRVTEQRIHGLSQIAGTL